MSLIENSKRPSSPLLIDNTERAQALYSCLRCCYTGDYEELRCIIWRYSRVCVYDGYLVMACELDLDRPGKFYCPVTGKLEYFTCVQLASRYGHDSNLVVLLTTPLVRNDPLYNDLVERISVDEVTLEQLTERRELRMKAKRIAQKAEINELNEGSIPELTWNPITPRNFQIDNMSSQTIKAYVPNPTFREAAGRGFVRCAEYLLAGGFSLDKTRFTTMDVEIYQTYQLHMGKKFNFAPPPLKANPMDFYHPANYESDLNPSSELSTVASSSVSNNNVKMTPLGAHLNDLKSRVLMAKQFNNNLNPKTEERHSLTLRQLEILFTDLTDVEEPFLEGFDYDVLPIPIGGSPYEPSEHQYRVQPGMSVACCYLNPNEPVALPRADPRQAIAPQALMAATVPEGRYAIERLMLKHETGQLFARDLIAERFIYQDREVVHHLIRNWIER